MSVLAPSATQQIAEIAQWLSTQHDEEMDLETTLLDTHKNRDAMLGEMRFLIRTAHAPGVTSERIALYLKYLKSRQDAVIEINSLLAAIE